MIGEANLKIKAGREKGAGGKRGGRKGEKETKPSKKQKVSGKNAKDGNGTNTGSEPKEKKLKLLREPGKWIMGRSIQICYVMEDMELSSSATLVFRKKENDTDPEPDNAAASNQNTPGKECQSSEKVDDDTKLVPLATFRSWKKLPKRLNLWVFQFDPDDPCDLSSSEGGGFPRPSLLPMADIFRSVGGED